MKRMLSGITTTGQLTIGNYIGAIKQFIKFQNDYELFIFAANLHGLTIPYDISPRILKQNTYDIIALYLALGLQSENTHIFLQSEVPAHSQMCLILQFHTSIGELERMTQFKDKANNKLANKTFSVPTGLLTYPTLMASDILLYDPDFVPVGKDQKQHIELTRNIAERLNNKYKKELFRIPQIITNKEIKIMNLQEPTKKMSKSALDSKTYIALLDNPSLAKSKIMQAKTDSENCVRYDSSNKPGISNLINIFAELENITTREIVNRYRDKSYKVFKNDLGNVIEKFLITLQNNFDKIRTSNILEKKLIEGAKVAKIITSKKLDKVEEILGLK